MNKYLLFCLFGLFAVSKAAFAENIPVTSNGSSDLWTGVPVTSCTFNTGGTDAANSVVMMSTVPYPNQLRGSLLGVSLSSGAAGEYVRVYDSSTTNTGGINTLNDGLALLPPIPFSPTLPSESLSGFTSLSGKGLAFNRGLVVGVAAAAAARKGVCLHYLIKDKP